MANRYWVATTGGNWSSTSSWSSTSGGSSGASVPSTSDNVYLDSNSVDSSSRTITINGSYGCASLTIDGLDDTCTVVSGVDVGSGERPLEMYDLVVFGNIYINNTNADLTGLVLSHSGENGSYVDINGQHIYGLYLYNNDSGAFTYTHIKSSGMFGLIGKHPTAWYASFLTFEPNLEITLTFDNYLAVSGYYDSEGTFDPYNVTFNNTKLIFDNLGSTNEPHYYMNSASLDQSDTGALNTSQLDIDFIFSYAGTEAIRFYNWESFNNIRLINNTGNYVYLDVQRSLNCSSITYTNDNITIWLDDEVQNIINEVVNNGTDNKLVLANYESSYDTRIFEVDSDLPFTIEGYSSGSPSTARIGNGALGSNITLNKIGLTNIAYPIDSVESLPITYRARILKGGLVIKEFKDLNSVSIGQKVINTLTREANISISVTPTRLKQIKEKIAKYNSVDIIEENKRSPSGEIVFSGYILRHTYDYIKHVLTLHLASNGFVFERRILEDDYTQIEVIGASTYNLNRSVRNGDYLIYSQVINFSIDLKVIEATFYRYMGNKASDYLSTSSFVKVYSSYSDAVNDTNPLATSFITDTYTVIDEVADRFILDNAVTVASGTTLYFRFTSNGSNYSTVGFSNTANTYAEIYDKDDNLLYADNKQLSSFAYYSDGADTTYVVGENNAEYWFKDIINLAKLRSINLKYNMAYLKPPDYDFDYYFNTNTYKEVFDKFVETATEDTYYYYDDVKDIIIYKQNSRKPEVSIAYQDLTSLDMDIDAKGISNEVFFTGGDTGGGVYLYEKYKDTNSQKEINQVLQDRLNDNRVTLSSTASKLSNRFLNTRKYVEFNATASMPKDKFLDYDIEIGSVVVITGIEGSDYPSLYDVAKFDVNVFDYDTADIGSNVFIVASIDDSSVYEVKLALGTLPPSLFTDVAYANKKITLIETANNDTAPS